MNIPIIIFNDSTDYDAVLITTKNIFSILTATNRCNCNSSLNSCLCKTLGYIFSADYNKTKPDQINYEEAVEAAYLSLNCNC